jgi:hypothetical protein
MCLSLLSTAQYCDTSLAQSQRTNRFGRDGHTWKVLLDLRLLLCQSSRLATRRMGHRPLQSLCGLQKERLGGTAIRELAGAALSQVSKYATVYIDRLNPRHLQFLGQLKTLLQGFAKSMTRERQLTSTSQSSTDMPQSSTRDVAAAFGISLPPTIGCH